MVSLDRLIDDLWGTEPPPAATGSLQAYIANLRRILEPCRAPRTPPQVLVSRPPGYRLDVPADRLDATRFANDLRTAGQALAERHPDQACRALEAALAGWRGEPYADLASWPFIEAEVARLRAQFETAQELYAEALLAAGRAREAVGFLEPVVAESSLREHPQELLALALYRSGRQGRALSEVLWGLWANRFLRAEYRDADDLAEQLRRLADRTGFVPLQISARHASGVLAFQRGHFTDAVRILAAAAELGAGYMAMAQQGCGAPAAEVRELRDTALRIAERVGWPDVRAYALFGAAQLAVLQDRPAEAGRFADEAIGVCRRYGLRLWQALCEAFAGWASSRAGGSGAEQIRAALTELDGMHNRMLRTVVLGLEAEARLAAGESRRPGRR